jgi:branched-chain amino acid transport system substrate-binding protein
LSSHRNRIIRGIMVLLAGILLVCSATGFAQQKTPIVVGSIWDLVGFGGEIGQGLYRGAELAAELANNAGGIKGRKIEYINIDGQSELDVIAGAAKRLTQELKVVAGMGSEDDSLTSASGPVFQAEKCVFLTGSATTPTQPDIGEYIFMPAYGDHFQGTAVAKFIVDELGWKKVAVLWDAGSAYSTYLSNVFSAAFKHYTGDKNAIVVAESYMTGDLVFTAQLTRIKASQDKLDGIVTFPPEPQDAPVYAKQAGNLGIKLPFFFTDGADDISLAEVGGNAVEGAYVSTQFAGDFPITELGKEFVKNYTAKYKEEPGCFEAVGYDTMRLVLESIETIIEEQGEAKWEAMTLAEKRTAIRDMLQAKPVFETTTLPISYPDAETAIYPRCPDKPVVFKRVQNGKLLYVSHMESSAFSADLEAILKTMGIK